MTFHHQHTHGRVFRGLEARNMLQSHKRDSHGDQPKMHVPEGFDAQHKAQDDGSNNGGDSPNVAVSYVYVTMSQTFAGPAMYTTLTNGPAPTDGANQPQPTGESGKSGNGNGNGSGNGNGNGNGNGASSAPTRTSSVAVQTNSLDVAPPRTTFATSTSNIGMGASSSSAASTLAPGSVQGNENADSGSQPTSSMSGGAAAGLALGLILGIALIAGLVFYFYRRRTRLGKHEELNEKHASLTNGAGTRNPETAFRPVSIHSTHSMSPSTAPRLSLRPVTQFAPLFNANANRSNNTLNAPNTSLTVANQPQSAWERHASSSRQDPFADADAVIVSEKQSRPESPPATNPFDQPERTSAESARKAAASPSPTDREGPVAALAPVEDSAVAAAVQKSERPTSKASVESSTPPTPASVKSTMAITTPPMVAAATAAAGVAGPGPAAGQTSPIRAPNNVHRVQLDFKPSMDDELGLRTGQLVRLLHEYDDGWALCVRMDRSQQGAVPRTCLSKLPVKPRPQGPPPNGRPGPPQGRPGTSHGPGPQNRPGTSHGPRSPPGPPGPSGPNADMFPRPLTPSQANRDRSQSVTAGEASSGVPPRKPVPGQAM